MKTLLAALFIFIAVNASASGDDNDYSIANITASLLKNANAVKRSEEIVFEITEGNKAKYYRRVAYTILNEQGDRWAGFSAGYDKLRSIESFDGTLFDASGKKLKSLKKGDIKDESGSDEASLADDHCVKWHSFFYKVYRFTVEYEIKIRFI